MPEFDNLTFAAALDMAMDGARSRRVDSIRFLDQVTIRPTATERHSSALVGIAAQNAAAGGRFQVPGVSMLDMHSVPWLGRPSIRLQGRVYDDMGSFDDS